MSYLKRVEKRREQDRVTEARRVVARQVATLQGAPAMQPSEEALRRRAEARQITAPDPEPAHPKCKRWILVKDIFFHGRCGMPRGHCSNCIRREQVTRQMFDEELVRMAEKRALDEAVKAKALATTSGEEGK